MDNIVQLPSTASSTLIWIGAAFVVLLAGAVAFELGRQWLRRQGQIAAGWRHVAEIAKEKELSDEELKVLRQLIHRWSRRDPLRPVTVRQEFEACVEREMGAIVARGDTGLFAERGQLLRRIRVRLALDYIPFGQRIDSTRELYMGQSLWMSRAEDKPPRWAQLRIMDADEAYLYAALKETQAERMPRFTPGERVLCRMWRDDDARYRFTVVFERSEEDPALLVFRHSSELDRIQSRAHFRVRHNQDTRVGILNAPKDGGEEDLKHRRAVTRLRGRITSLSAGGFALVTEQPVSSHVLLRVTLDLDTAEPFQVEARIVSTVPISGGRHLVRATYAAISDEDREKIAQHVTHRQQPLLQSDKA